MKFTPLLLCLTLGVCAEEGRVLKPRVVDSIPHDTSHFTEGLLFAQGAFWESTGLVGASAIYRITKDGASERKAALPEPYFGEGIAERDGRLMWLTWKDGKAFSMAMGDDRLAEAFQYKGEGWGLANWKGFYVRSDGSPRLAVLTPGDFGKVSSIDVMYKSSYVWGLNELEVVGNVLYANVWKKDYIIVLDLPDGQVVRILNLTLLCESVRKRYPEADVLNGIAWDGATLWVTGKRWPWIYKLEGIQ